MVDLDTHDILIIIFAIVFIVWIIVNIVYTNKFPPPHDHLDDQ